MRGTEVCRISRLPFIEGEKIAVFILRGVPFPYEDGDHWERLIVCPPIFGKYDSKNFNFIKDIYPDSFTLNILKRAFAVEDDDDGMKKKRKFDYNEVAKIIYDLDDVPDHCDYPLNLMIMAIGEIGEIAFLFLLLKKKFIIKSLVSTRRAQFMRRKLMN